MTIIRTYRTVLATFLAAFAVAVAVAMHTPDRAEAHTVRPATCHAVASLWPTPAARKRIATVCLRLATEHNRAHTCARTDLTPYAAIDCEWPADLRAAAKDVARCESTANVSNALARARGLGRWARNGTHWGVFQLGTPEREDHGEYRLGDDARLQVRSALSLYRDRGWQPWTASGSGGSRCHSHS